MTIRLNGATSGYTEIDAPAVAGNNTLLLPTGNGTSGQVLSTNGSGALSWSSVTSSKILQVVQATKTNTFTTASTTWTDLTGLSATITPSSATSNVLVLISVCFNGDSSTNGYIKLVRGSTDIAIGDANGSRVRFTLNALPNSNTSNWVSTSSATILDSPATTSATIYKAQIQSQGAGTVYVNRSVSWTDGSSSGTGFSSLVLMEVAP